MALDVVRQAMETERVIGDERAQALVRAEAIVPGAGRDPVRILMDEARFSLGGVEVQTDRVVLDGVAFAQALYRLGDGGDASAMAAQAPLSRAIDVPGAAAGMSCLAEGFVEHVDAAYENGHMVFQIAVSLRVRVLELTPCEAVTGAEGLDGLETRYMEIESVKLSAESGADALLEGEARMPPMLDARTALMDWCAVRVDGASADLGGVRVTGAVLAEALVGSGVPGRPVALVKYSLPFNQLVDMPDWLAKDVEAMAEVKRLTTRLASAEDGVTALRFEAETHIRVRANGKDAAMALADAYGTGETDVDCAYQTARYCAGVERVTHSETVRANMLLEEGAPQASTVIAARVRPQIAQYESKAEGTAVSGILEARVLYLAAGTGQLCSASADLPFTLACPFAVSEADSVRVEAESADAGALMSDRLEVNCALRLTGVRRIERSERIVESMTERSAKKEPFGVVLYWPEEGESLWEIGKKYRVSQTRLETLGGDAQANGGALLVRA